MYGCFNRNSVRFSRSKRDRPIWQNQKPSWQFRRQWSFLGALVIQSFPFQAEQDLISKNISLQKCKLLAKNCYIVDKKIQIYIINLTGMNRYNWTSQEDANLREVVSRNGSEDWTRNSQLLRQLSTTVQAKKRTGKQCRQRWYNHLDPGIQKSPWKIEQQTRLFEMHKIHGNKWKELTKFMPGRTDNDIKNHFYSTLRRSLRRLNKYSGQKNSTSQMRQIKPSVLTFIINHIYSQEQQQSADKNLMQSLKELPELIFKFSNFKPIKNNMEQKIDNSILERISSIMSLVDQFKQHYQKQQQKNQLNKPRQPDRSNFVEIQGLQNAQYSNIISNLPEQGQKQFQNRYNGQQFEMMSALESIQQIWINKDNKKVKQNLEFAPIVTIQRKFSLLETQPTCKKIVLLLQTEERIQKIQKFDDRPYRRGLSFHQDEDINDQMMPLQEPSASINENSYFMSDLVVIGRHIEPIQLNVAQEYVEIDQVLYENYQN